MAPGSEHRSPIRTDYIAKNSIRGFVNKFLMGLSDSEHPQAQYQNYAPQYHNVVGVSPFSAIYWGHKVPASVVVENYQARQSKEASAASDLFLGGICRRHRHLQAAPRGEDGQRGALRTSCSLCLRALGTARARQRAGRDLPAGRPQPGGGRR